MAKKQKKVKEKLENNVVKKPEDKKTEGKRGSITLRLSNRKAGNRIEGRFRGGRVSGGSIRLMPLRR